MNQDTCISCGEVVPEGWWVCYCCLMGSIMRTKNPLEEQALDHRTESCLLYC